MKFFADANDACCASTGAPCKRVKRRQPVGIHKGQCIATGTVRKDTIYIKPFQADNKAACERAEKQIRNLTQCSECRYE